MKHLLRQDRWILDFAAALIFAVGMTAGALILGDRWDGGQTHWNSILILSGIALASYTTAFLAGIAVRKHALFVRSWIWMSIVGAFVCTVGLTLAAMPMWLEYYRSFDADSGRTQERYIFDHLPGVLAICVIFAGLGAVFLVAVRFVVAYVPKICRDVIKRQD